MSENMEPTCGRCGRQRWEHGVDNIGLGKCSDGQMSAFPTPTPARSEAAGGEVRTFPLVDNPPIPWSVAEVAYRQYARTHGMAQSMERLAERGGFWVSELDELHPTWREDISELTSLRQQLADVSEAVGTTEFMDPPDGGDVSLAEQVRRMRAALAAARVDGERLAREVDVGGGTCEVVLRASDYETLRLRAGRAEKERRYWIAKCREKDQQSAAVWDALREARPLVALAPEDRHGYGTGRTLTLHRIDELLAARAATDEAVKAVEAELRDLRQQRAATCSEPSGERKDGNNG